MSATYTFSANEPRAGQVAAMYTSGDFGFLIRDATEDNGGNERGFHSRKQTDQPPQVVITFDRGGGDGRGERQNDAKDAKYAKVATGAGGKVPA